jgi:hypothetical protein
MMRMVMAKQTSPMPIEISNPSHGGRCAVEHVINFSRTCPTLGFRKIERPKMALRQRVQSMFTLISS